MDTYTTFMKRPDGALRITLTPRGAALVERRLHDGVALVANLFKEPLPEDVLASHLPDLILSDLTLEHIGPRVPDLPDRTGDGQWYLISLDFATLILAERWVPSAKPKRKLHGVWWAPMRSAADLLAALRKDGYVDLLPARTNDTGVPHELRAALAECMNLPPPSKE